MNVVRNCSLLEFLLDGKLRGVYSPDLKRKRFFAFEKPEIENKRVHEIKIEIGSISQKFSEVCHSKMETPPAPIVHTWVMFGRVHTYFSI